MKKAVIIVIVLGAAFGGTLDRTATAEEARMANCTATYFDPSRLTNPYFPTSPVYTMDCSPWCPNPSPYVGTAGGKVMIASCILTR